MKPTLFLCALTALTASAANRPNVLFICVDDLKPILGCYGDPIIKSPNIDKLAAGGVLFANAYTNQAVCAPSRNALLTGIRCQTMGIYDLGTNFRKSIPDAVTLPQYFKQNGYRTEAVGKIFHVGHGNHEDPDSWSVPHFQAKTVTYALKQNNSTLTREGALFENKNPADLPKGAAYESADVPDDTYADGIIANEVIKRIESAKEKPDQPFFIACGFLKPHLPFCAPSKYWNLYDRNKFALAEVKEPPIGAPSYAPQFGGELRNYKDIPGGKTALEDDLQRTLIHGYYAAVSYMDAQLGRVIETLQKTGLDKNTIIVVWGDHGWHLGDHGMWCKHTNYEQAAHIPLIVIAPGVTPTGAKSMSMVESVDIYPTLAQLAGLPARDVLEGKSFAATLKDPAAPTKEAIIHVYPRGERIGRAVRTERYRLVEWKKPSEGPEAAEYELYDYQADPLEKKNWAAEKTEVVDQLKQILAKQPQPKPQWKAGAGDGAKKQPVDRTALFEKKDVNHDGKLTYEEFMANQPDPDGAAKRWKTFDANNDGFLSKEEFINSGKVAKPQQ